MKKVFLLFLLTFTGWFNEEVQAQCMQSTPFAENFDGNSWISPSGWNNNGSIPSCWTRNLTNRNYLWMPSDPSFVSANSGPAGDHTTGSGGYAFAEGWFTGITTTNQDVTNLITPPIDLSTDTLPRLVFYYHMFGSDITWLNICDTTVLNPTYVVNGLQVAFDGASSSSGTGLAYYWSFGNGILGQGDTLTVNYATAGVYAVSLLAVNSCGDSILTSFDVTLCPLVNLTFSSTVVGNLFTFSAQPSNLLNYQWGFGDGNAGTGAVVSNSYGTNGSFTVTLSG